MKKKWTKRLSLVLAAVLAATATAGCGTGATESKPSEEASVGAVPEEKLPDITIVGFNWGWDSAVEGEDVVGPAIAEDLGYQVTFDLQKVGNYEEVEKRLQMWAAAGMSDWPDLLFTGSSNITRDVIARMGAAGKLIEMNGIIDQMPNVKQAVRYSLPITTNAEGKSYMLPQNWSDLKAYKIDPNNWIRADWLQELGLEMPKTVEEYETVLRAFKDNIKGPDGKAVTPLIMFGEGFLWEPLWFMNADQVEWQFVDGQAVNLYYEQPENLVRTLSKLNQWYSEGLLDHESFTLKQGQIDEKIISGKAGACFGMTYQANTYTNALAESNPDAMMVTPPRLYDAEVMDQANPFIIPMEIWASYSVRADIAPDKLKSFTNFLEYSMTEEGFFKEWWGVEGTHWQKDDQNKIVDTPECAERLKGDWNLRAHEGIQWYTGISNYDLIVQYTAPTTFDLRKDMIQSWQNLGREYNEAYSVNPNKYITAGPVEMKNSLGASERFKQMIMQAVTAPNVSEVQKIVTDWAATEKSLGYEEIKAERTESCKNVNIAFNYDS